MGEYSIVIKMMIGVQLAISPQQYYMHQVLIFSFASFSKLAM